MVFKSNSYWLFKSNFYWLFKSNSYSIGFSNPTPVGFLNPTPIGFLKFFSKKNARLWELCRQTYDLRSFFFFFYPPPPPPPPSHMRLGYEVTTSLLHWASFHIVNDEPAKANSSKRTVPRACTIAHMDSVAIRPAHTILLKLPARSYNPTKTTVSDMDGCIVLV